MAKRNKTGHFHSVKIDIVRCIGCVACMKVCPTKAIRVRKRRAHIMYERCIDCGECLRVCHYEAVNPMTTSSTDLNRFKFKVALPSPVLYTQFGEKNTPHEILSALKNVGFDYVYDEALMCEMSSLAIQEYLGENKSPRPIISSTCPVVVRLIQRLFPSLCELIIRIEPPREIAAKNLREEISETHKIPPKDIGIFHITPCAAKMVSINHPETMKRSYLDGAISIYEIFNSLMMKLKKTKRPSMFEKQHPMSGIGIGWTVAGGEVSGFRDIRSVSVSGVYDTIRILEDVESGRLKHIEYLECFICPDGCIGGPLTVENRFISKSNVLRFLKIYGSKEMIDRRTVKRLYKEQFFSFESSVKPKPFAALDKDRTTAIKKLNLKEKMLAKLPKIDCGACGAPDCETLADDIARSNKKLEDCVFLKRGNKK